MKTNDAKAIVTGGASGMGKAFVLGLARDGADVVAADLNAAGLEALVAESTELPGTVYGQLCDVSNEDDVVQLIDRAREQMGGLNVIVNNAGIFRDGLLVKTDRETGKVKGTMSLSNWQKVIDVDLTGPFLCTREFARSFIDNGDGPEGVIIGISSISRHGNVGQTNYSAAKAGLVADTKLWGLELARYGLRTGAIAPGFIQTPILDGMKPEVLERMVKGVPLRRTGTTEEIYAGIRFIIECGYFTGRCIDIDGGLVL
jgi:3-oxoacyl-[acyl-carrier protein] reductase